MMLCSCSDMATVGVKGLCTNFTKYFARMMPALAVLNTIISQICLIMSLQTFPIYLFMYLFKMKSYIKVHKNF